METSLYLNAKTLSLPNAVSFSRVLSFYSLYLLRRSSWSFKDIGGETAKEPAMGNGTDG